MAKRDVDNIRCEAMLHPVLNVPKAELTRLVDLPEAESHIFEFQFREDLLKHRELS
jgi:hypothetical protein